MMATIGLYWGAFVVITTVFSTKYSPFGHIEANNATALNSKYIVRKITIFAYSLYVQKLF